MNSSIQKMYSLRSARRLLATVHQHRHQPPFMSHLYIVVPTNVRRVLLKSPCRIRIMDSIISSTVALFALGHRVTWKFKIAWFFLIKEPKHFKFSLLKFWTPCHPDSSHYTPSCGCPGAPSFRPWCTHLDQLHAGPVDSTTWRVPGST